VAKEKGSELAGEVNFTRYPKRQRPARTRKMTTKESKQSKKANDCDPVNVGLALQHLAEAKQVLVQRTLGYDPIERDKAMFYGWPTLSITKTSHVL